MNAQRLTSPKFQWRVIIQERNPGLQSGEYSFPRLLENKYSRVSYLSDRRLLPEDRRFLVRTEP